MTPQRKILAFILPLAIAFSFCSVGIAKVEKNEAAAIVNHHFSVPAAETSSNFSFTQQDAIASMRFVWNAPVNVAAFTRNGKIWMVFDKPNTIDVAKLKEEARGMAKEIYTLPHPAGSIVIIVPQDGVKYALRKEGLLWIMDLYNGRAPRFEKQNLTIFTQFDSLKNSYLFMPTTFAGGIISILDPEIGDAISISTTSQLGLGYDAYYRYPDFDILPTSQGLAFIINAPDIVLNRGNSGITLKAIGRSLNITGDLDALKQRQISLAAGQTAENVNAFDLSIPAKVLNQRFIDTIEDYKKQILSAPVEEKNALRIQLAKYYIYNGLGPDALYILNKMTEMNIPEAQTEYFHALSGIANFLARRYPQAVEHFSFGRIPDTIEGIFWRTIAQSAYRFEEGNNAVILTHISLMRDYPQAIKDKIAVIAAGNAIAVDDDLSAQNFIDILNSVPDRMRNLTPQITYLTAQKMEMQGYLRNAIKEYQPLLNSPSAMFSSLARLRHTILSQMLNFIDTKTAVAELEKLRFAWGEKSFQISLLSKLSDFYLKDHDYYNALRTLNELGFVVDSDEKIAISKKMVKVFEDIFIGNHADEVLTPIKALALFEDFRWLSELSEQQNTIMQKLADRLVSVDLLPRAKNLLLTLMMQDNLSPDDMGRVGARLAVIYLFEKTPDQALDILDATDNPAISPEIAAPRRLIRAKALSDMHRTDQALALLKNDYSPNALRFKFDIYWKAKDWDNASNTIKYLIKEPRKNEALSQEQINYILDWATTLKRAGKETVLVRLRNKFMPFFKDTPHFSTFNVLTNRLEKEEININRVRSVISDIQNFNNFAKFYTHSLEAKAP
ncbi:MAG: hypothetical protein IJ529_05880 [Alphaproteobacteria bacterium]|nr:hypothetical protein [Alphaproteobacteria bacterium]MBQ9235644.1 hypothetical protein [Alphaproteobacteria bacterium]